MEYNTFPSDYYFKWITTEQDYNKFKATGSAWEVEPNCPSTWEEHCKMAQQWSIGKWHGVKPQYVILEGK